MCSRRTFLFFVALAGGFIGSRLVFSQDTAAPTATAPDSTSSSTAAAPALPDYYDGHATDTNGDGRVDGQDAAKWPDPTGAAAGYWTTPAAPPGDGDPSGLTGANLYDRIAHNLFSINVVWTLITGFLVMFMQAGFAMVEGGLCRAKNSAHTMSMNLMIYPLGCFAFYVYGFALGWGNWWNGPVPPGWYPSLGPGLSILNHGWGLGADPSAAGVFKFGIIGTKGWCLSGFQDVSVLALFFFQMVFFDTTATIPTGALAERWAWKNFCLYGLWVALPYCIYANWVWGGGWLAQAGKNWNWGHGAVDFAGSGVVHAMGGIIGLAGGMVLGPRIGKYVDGKPRAIPGHSIPFAVIGTFILAFGWFGFNPGSTLSGTDLRISAIVVNTMLSSVTGGLAAMFFLMFTGKKPDPSMMCNGVLSGLVAITAPCAFVEGWAACVIGAAAGVLVVLSVNFFDRIGIDDPVGAISVHGTNGLWGVLSVGIFSSGVYGAGWNGVVRDEWVQKAGADGVRGILYGDSGQLMAQALDVLVVFVFGMAMALVWFKLSDMITPIRVSRETELAGLDVPEMGAHGWPDFVAVEAH